MSGRCAGGCFWSFRPCDKPFWRSLLCWQPNTFLFLIKEDERFGKYAVNKVMLHLLRPVPNFTLAIDAQTTETNSKDKKGVPLWHDLWMSYARLSWTSCQQKHWQRSLQQTTYKLKLHVSFHSQYVRKVLWGQSASHDVVIIQFGHHIKFASKPGAPLLELNLGSILYI